MNYWQVFNQYLFDQAPEIAIRFINLTNVNLEVKDELGKTALHKVAICNKPKLLKILLERGANIEAKDSYYNQTALHYASTNNNSKISKFLLKKGANLEAKDHNGKTPLHLAACKAKVKVINLLLKKGANLEAKDHNGKTPLHLAARKAKVEVINLLLKEGANLEAKDHNGKTPLHLAAHEGEVEVVKILLKKGANIEAKDDIQDSVIETTIKSYLHPITTIKYLSSCGAIISSKNKQILNNKKVKFGDKLTELSIKYNINKVVFKSFEQALILTNISQNNFNLKVLPLELIEHILSYLQDEIIHPSSNKAITELAYKLNSQEIKNIINKGSNSSNFKSKINYKPINERLKLIINKPEQLEHQQQIIANRYQ